MSYDAPADVWGVAAVGCLLAVALADGMHRRLPNALCLCAVTLGVGYWTTLLGRAGIWLALGGMGMGLLCGLLPYACGWAGGGDAKVVAALGSWVGWRGVAPLLLLSLLLLGILACTTLLAAAPAQRRRWQAQLGAPEAIARGQTLQLTLPYASVLSLAMVLRQLGWVRTW